MIQKQTNQKAELIIRWRETLSTMNDERFFEIMRVYLGEIHTPFNKSNLIEQLSAIFRKEENKKTILAFLSDFDKEIISAIYAIKDCTQEKLLEFFKSEYLISDIYSELINLEERLIIYSYKDKDSEIKQNIFALNPILEETLLKVVNLKCLLPEPEFAERNYDVPFAISPNFIAAFYSFILENPGMCKNNAEIKKRDFDKICQIFSGHENCIKLLLNSFINLGLIRLGEKELFVDKKRFKIFAELSEVEQYAFIAASSVTRLGRQSLQLQAQLFLNTIISIPKEGLSLFNVFRIAFLIKYQKNRTTDFPTQSRFSKILESHRNLGTNGTNNNLSDEIIENILRNSIEFGFLQEVGKDEKGNEIVVANEIFRNFAENNKEKSGVRTSVADSEETSSLRNSTKRSKATFKKGIVNINAGTSIAILPGLSLQELLPLTTFLNVVSFNTVCEFEITKKSIYRAFDDGIFSKEILNLLSEYNSYKIPQSLEMNIKEWENSYSSAIIYKGYVLKVDSKTERIIENNPKISPFINLKLAEGVYLLNIPVEQEPTEFIEKSGIELLSAVKTPEQNVEVAKFPVLNVGKNYVNLQTNSSVVEPVETTKGTNNSANIAEQIKSDFLSYLKSLNLSKQQTECLENRIKKNIILTKEQIKPETVRLEILEADGMNFHGKIHLIENAINHSDMLEITIPSEENPNKMEKFFGKPIFIARQTNDSLLKMQLNNSEETKIFSVSRINYAKIIKTSLI